MNELRQRAVPSDMAWKDNKFIVVVWLLAVVMIIWLCIWPMAMNIVADKTWKRVPCVVTKDQGRELERFFYIQNGTRYANYYRDFWNLDFGLGDVVRSKNLELPDGRASECYVHPSNPEKAVLYLVGISDLSRSGRSLGISFFLLIAGGMLPWLAGKKTKNK